MENVTSKTTRVASDSPSIALLIPYFGRVPWELKFFIHSCSYNPDVNFIFITDMDISGTLPDNITVVSCSLAEVSKRFAGKLGFEVNIPRPYKLCDLRPSYGLVFSDLLEGYDFWGHCDIDLVFGNIRSFVTAEILNRHDVVTVKKDYIAGFFSLFRNNEKLNTLFTKSKHYKKVFQTPVHYCFDECNWQWREVQAGKDILELNTEVDSMTHLVKAAERSGDISVYWREMDHGTGNIMWDRGELIENDEKGLLCHFNFFKHLDGKFVPGWKTVPERFYMNSFYFSRHVPGSVADQLLRSFLQTARSINWGWRTLNQYGKWVMSYLFASRRVDASRMKNPAELAGTYKQGSLSVNVSLIDHRLHASIEGAEFPLFHKGAAKFVLAKCKFRTMVNIELDFQFNENISAYMLQVTGSGWNTWLFFKIS